MWVERVDDLVQVRVQFAEVLGVQRRVDNGRAWWALHKLAQWRVYVVERKCFWTLRASMATFNVVDVVQQLATYNFCELVDWVEIDGIKEVCSVIRLPRSKP